MAFRPSLHPPFVDLNAGLKRRSPCFPSATLSDFETCPLRLLRRRRRTRLTLRQSTSDFIARHDPLFAQRRFCMTRMMMPRRKTMRVADADGHYWDLDDEDGRADAPRSLKIGALLTLLNSWHKLRLRLACCRFSPLQFDCLHLPHTGGRRSDCAFVLD